MKAYDVYKKKGIKYLWNLFLLFLSYKLKLSYSLGQPIRIELECTTCCNLNCIMCPRTKGGIQNAHSMNKNMVFKKFKDIICQFKYCNVLSLHCFGEPLMNPQITEIIQYAKKKGLSVRFNTNATLLNREVSRKLVEFGLDDLYISIESADQNNYKKIRRGADLTKVISNINYLTKLKKSMNKSTPKLSFYTVVIKDNYKDLPGLIKLAKDLEIEKIFLVSIQDDSWISTEKLFKELMEFYGLSASSEKFSKEHEYQSIPEHIKKLFIWYKNSLGNLDAIKKRLKQKTKSFIISRDLMKKLVEHRKLAENLGVKLSIHMPVFDKRKMCELPWMCATIGVSGTVSPCNNLNRLIEMGHISQGNWKKIWNSTLYKKFRKEVRKNKVYFCQNCSFRKLPYLHNIHFNNGPGRIRTGDLRRVEAMS